MNRLWIRFTLVIIGILLAVIILPVLIGPVFMARGEPTEGNEALEALFVAASLSSELQAQLQQSIIEAAQALFIRALLVVGVGGAIAGVILSRTLSAPLQNLADGARAIAGRNLAYRVPVRGSDEMRTVARSFNDMAGQLEQAETLRRQLLADVAHELRNPIHVLRGNLQAILDGVYQLNEEELGRLLGQTEHLTRLVNDLHELALAEARQLPLHRQAVDLGQLTKDAAVARRPECAALNVADSGSDIGPQPKTSKCAWNCWARRRWPRLIPTACVRRCKTCWPTRCATRRVTATSAWP